MSNGADLTAEEFEEVYGGKPPAKLEFWLRGRDLYHRDGAGWYRYPPESSRFESLAGSAG